MFFDKREQALCDFQQSTFYTSPDAGDGFVAGWEACNREIDKIIADNAALAEVELREPLLIRAQKIHSACKPRKNQKVHLIYLGVGEANQAMSIVGFNPEDGKLLTGFEAIAKLFSVDLRQIRITEKASEFSVEFR